MMADGPMVFVGDEGEAKVIVVDAVLNEETTGQMSAYRYLVKPA